MAAVGISVGFGGSGIAVGTGVAAGAQAASTITAMLRVNEVYDPDGQPVVFDLQFEAEILGCDLVWARRRRPPWPRTRWPTRTKVLPGRCPSRHEGRLPVVLEAMRT